MSEGQAAAAAPADGGGSAPAPAAASLGNGNQQLSPDAGTAGAQAEAISAKVDGQPSVKTTEQITGTDVSSDNSWIESLSPDQQNYVKNKGWKDSKSVLESYINLEKLRGVPEDRLLKIPQEADDPNWSKVYSKLGKPDSKEGYEVPQADTEEMRAFNEWAKDNFYDLNLTKQQAQGLMERYANYVNEVQQQAIQNYDQQYKQQDANLKKEWGAAYHQNIALAQRAAQEFNVPAEAIEALEQSLGFDGVMKFMHSLSAKVGESKYIEGDGARNPNAKLTPDQAKSQIAALKKDKSFVDKYLSGDVEAKKLMSNLHKFAYPQG